MSDPVKTRSGKAYVRGGCDNTFLWTPLKRQTPNSDLILEIPMVVLVVETAQESRNPIMSSVTVELTDDKEVKVTPKDGESTLLKDVQLVSASDTQLVITGTDQKNNTLRYYTFKHQELSKQPDYDKFNSLPKTDPIKALEMI